MEATVEKPRCPDCAVPAGTFHEAGCDVARCRQCGFQALSCEHREASRFNTRWQGEWPGLAEAAELGLFVKMASVMHPPIERTTADDPDRTPDLNRLAEMAGTGQLTWDRAAERWKLAE